MAAVQQQAPLLDIAGRRFGFLEALRPLGRDGYWHCRCHHCGLICQVRRARLLADDRKSCGRCDAPRARKKARPERITGTRIYEAEFQCGNRNWRVVFEDRDVSIRLVTPSGLEGYATGTLIAGRLSVLDYYPGCRAVPRLAVSAIRALETRAGNSKRYGDEYKPDRALRKLDLQERRCLFRGLGYVMDKAA